MTAIFQMSSRLVRRLLGWRDRGFCRVIVFGGINRLGRTAGIVRRRRVDRGAGILFWCWFFLFLHSEFPNSVASVVPMGEPSPVHGSQPGPAEYDPLFPCVMSLKPLFGSAKPYSAGCRNPTRVP